MNGDRERILARVRAALSDVEPGTAVPFEAAEAGPEARYLRSGDRALAGRLALFAERCAAYQANVTVCADSTTEIAKAVGDACLRNEASSLLVPAGLERAWLPETITPLADEPPLPHRELAGCDGVITSCELGIAATGTFVLTGGPGQGRRAATLLPDLHVCVVHAEQIVETVPEAIERLGHRIAAGLPITFVSGPSATSDIELKRVEGVHGPRRLELIIVDPSS